MSEKQLPETYKIKSTTEIEIGMTMCYTGEPRGTGYPVPDIGTLWEMKTKMDIALISIEIIERGRGWWPVKEEKKEKEFECALSFTYNAKDPAEAAAQFLANIPHADWSVEVKNTETGELFEVDTEDWSAQEKGRELPAPKFTKIITVERFNGMSYITKFESDEEITNEQVTTYLEERDTLDREDDTFFIFDPNEIETVKLK